MVLFFKKEKRYTKFTTQKWSLATVALVGVGFVVSSQSATIDNAVSDLFTYSTLIGGGLVLAAAVIAATTTPANQLWGSHVRNEEKANENGNEKNRE